MSMYKIVDSNVLLDFPQIIQKEKRLVISTDVLWELDALKKHVNREVAFKARRAAVVISRHIEDITFDNTLETKNLAVDDKLLELTKSYAGELITNDVYLKIKAYTSGIRTSGYGGVEDYTGTETWFIDLNDEAALAEFSAIRDSGAPPKQFVFKENQYLIIKDEKEDEVLGIFVWRQGKLHQVMYHEIKNSWIRKIKPRPKNPEQVCLFDMLAHPEITIVYAGGSFGRGKSFILNNFALQELESGRINKIVYVPNNSYVANTLEVGTLPGELLAKIEGQIGPLVDLVGIDEIQRMLDNRTLEIVPMSQIRGRSFEDSIVIVNEAQNLTEDHIKLLIGRCGEGARLFLDGDYKQADSPIYRDRNGIKLALKLADSEKFAPIFGAVKLLKTERSFTAQAADYLDELTGGI